MLSILNNKGGVGKTASVANIGEALVYYERKVLLIDLDSQANLTILYQSRGAKIGKRTILQSFRERTGLPMYKVSKNLYLSPSEPSFANIEQEMVGMINREYILSNLIDEVRKDYDYILIDTPPSLGQVVYNAILASNRVYIPLTPEMLPYVGLSNIEQVCDSLSNATRTPVGISGIFFTRVERGTLSEQIMEATRQRFGYKVFNTSIRKNVAIAQANLANESLYDFAPESNGAKDYQTLTREIIEREERAHLVIV